MRTVFARSIAAAMIVLALVLVHGAVPHAGLHAALAQAGTCDPTLHDASRWHPPVDPATGCAFGHEHGDAPPQWIEAAGYQAGFDAGHGFHANTTPAENTTKHTSMKAMLATFGQQTAYVRTHLASNVMERKSRYHSYEVFLKDAAGAVSHWQGWFNSGSPDPADGQRRSKSLPDNGIRPQILVADYDALLLGRNCEQWYGTTSSWGWDLGLTICDSTTMQFAWENTHDLYGTPLTPEQTLDPANWIKLCDYGYPASLCKGADREIEVAWYGPGSTASPNRGNPPKDVTFWATQFGEIVSGPADPRCAGTTVKLGENNHTTVTHPNVCLSQFIAGTARAVENPNNRARKLYDVTGVGPKN